MIAEIADSNEAVATKGAAIVFAIPPAEEAAFTREVPLSEQYRVRWLLHAMRTIHEAKNISQECKRFAAMIASKAEFQGMRGFSWTRMRRKYYDFINGLAPYGAGDWRILLNKAKVKGEAAGLPKAFLEYWRGLCEDHQRVSSEALRELKQIYRTHYRTLNKEFVKAIPGYAEWPKATRTGYPKGWSENLYSYAPDKFELAAGRLGRKAASEHRLKARSSRVGLSLMEFVEFDDHEFNLVVNFPGNRAMRPRGFAALDQLSGSCFAHSVKPTLWDDQAEKKKVLTEKDFMWFVVAVLTGTGYRADALGTTLIVEHGTAAIREAFEQRIYDATGGHVRVARSGLYGRPAHGGQHKSEGGGNFRFKAHIEQFWRMIDDRLCGLPGQVGKDRDHAPEQLVGLMQYNRSLLKAAGVMSPEQAAQLQWPVLLWHQFVELMDEKFRAIDDETNHKLEGWEKLGFLTQEMREGQAMPAARRLSRREVFTSRCQELTRLGAHHLPMILGVENALRGGEPLTVRGGEFEFEDQNMGADPFRFIARTPMGRLMEGEKFTCFCNPFNPSVLVACDAKLRVVAQCPPVAMPCRNDREAIAANMGEIAKWEAEAMAPQRARHEEDAQRLAHMKAHNQSIIESKKVIDRVPTSLSKAESKAAAAELLEMGGPAPVAAAEATDLGDDFLNSL